MEKSIAQLFADGTVVQLSALLGIAVFFLIIGIREIKQEHPQGFFFLVLMIFFGLAHAVQIATLPESGPLGIPSDGFSFWSWIASLLCPAVIALFILRGMTGFVFSRNKEAMIKLFFGLTLLCFVYLLGASWPTDVKAILTIVWMTVLFRIELVETPE